MKPSQHIISEPVEPNLSEMCTWLQSLFHLHQRLRPHFARPEVHQRVLLYLQAIMSDIPRKNGWQIAEHARQSRPYGMQRLLSRAVWDEDGVRNDLRTLVCQTLCPPPVLPELAESEVPFPVLVIDESCFPKRGRHSAGVVPPSIVGVPDVWKTARLVSSFPMSPRWVMPSSIVSCICPKTGAPISHAGTPPISLSQSPLRPNPNWPSGW